MFVPITARPANGRPGKKLSPAKVLATLNKLGGANGIGRGLCERFHRDGAKTVVVADIDPAEPEASARRSLDVAFTTEAHTKLGPLDTAVTIIGLNRETRRLLIEQQKAAKALAWKEYQSVLSGALAVTDEEQIAEALKSVEERYGRVDILVNNAGIQHVANVEDFPAERWDAIIAINLSSAFHTTRAALTGLKKKGHMVSSEKLEGQGRVYRVTVA